MTDEPNPAPDPDAEPDPNTAAGHAFELELLTIPARNRLTRIYGLPGSQQQAAEYPEIAEPAGQLLAAVAWELTGKYSEDVRTEHIDDALTLIKSARADLDATEARLITAARARGRTWEQIADALGYPDRRAAQTRHKRLTSRIWVFNPDQAAPAGEPLTWRPSPEQIHRVHASQTEHDAAEQAPQDTGPDGQPKPEE